MGHGPGDRDRGQGQGTGDRDRGQGQGTGTGDRDRGRGAAGAYGHLEHAVEELDGVVELLLDGLEVREACDVARSLMRHERVCEREDALAEPRRALPERRVARAEVVVVAALRLH